MNTSLPTQIDTLVIGAGAAGLAAARQLQAAGQSVLVLEAAQRVGGRAWTDSTTFSVPIDRGCAWLHQADRNPFTPMARTLGLGALCVKDESYRFGLNAFKVLGGSYAIACCYQNAAAPAHR